MGGSDGGMREAIYMSKTVRQKVAGTTGLGCPVEMSQRSMVSVGTNWMSWRTSLDVAEWYVSISPSIN